MTPTRPTYSLNIPSLYDGLELDCRVYHPSSVRRGKVALIAHPYAPLGGSLDDPTVGTIGSSLLQAGYIVGTFNFRGAAGSKGKTSWTGKPELADYASIQAFMICYLANLRQSDSLDEADNVRQSSQSAGDHQHRPARVICAGYSYGSIMARRAPAADTLAHSIVKADAGSLEEEIFLRAAHLANLHQERRGSEPREGADKFPVAIGAEDNSESVHRSSRDHLHHALTLENIRESIERFRDRRKAARPAGLPNHGSIADLHILEDLSGIKTSYLLVSPPISVLSLLIASSAWAFESKVGSFRQLTTPAEGNPEERLVQCQSLGIWGHDDGMQSSSQLRKWAKNLESQQMSKFQSREIPGAGHFWREAGVMRALRTGITEWLAMVEEHCDT